MKKTTQLKRMLESSQIEFLMEAHNGLSAKIAEEAGFKGIWGSGLSISAALGVRDNNEASWTQVLEVVEFMSDATHVPILLDGDTGYGNFNNMRRLVKKLEQRGVAGVCIEDKVFPKTNSFLRGEVQPLAEIDEFCGKIKAGLEARSDSDFCVVARVEAFIAGWGLKEALKRAEAYRQAGATAILMHSKLSKPDEIFSFMKEWAGRSPVVIVPTKYYSTPTEDFEKHGVSTVIWANHQLRSAIRAMQETVNTIYTKRCLVEVEDKVVSVSEVFRLQNDQELEEAESRYLSTQESPHAILLAASRGGELGELTEDRPKAMLSVKGKPLLERLIQYLKEQGVSQITTVRGYKKEAFSALPSSFIDNDDFATTGELYSLSLAKKQLHGECVISYGDIMYRRYILRQLLDEKGEIVIVVDHSSGSRPADYTGDFVLCSEKSLMTFDQEAPQLKSIRLCKRKDWTGEVHGEWIGLLKSNAAGTEKIRAAMAEMEKLPSFKQLKVPDLMNYLVEKGEKIRVLYISGHWLDIDNMKDYLLSQKF
jgi:phosphoenolpyruvate phosphomutase